MIERPNPDALLEKIQQADQKAKRGKLKIFFGSSAGVGKTYAMLAAAKRKMADGIHVLVGVVETHNRQETVEQLQGLTILALKNIEYKGQTLKEFDIDEVLRQKPELILIDELAHSNVQGSRHNKRWQDVEEILEAGINVYTTLNVQHLESLNDVVGQVTGVKVRETLPDAFFDAADDVVLVDLPPDELIQRLNEGKVYIAKQAERAAKNFFRKGNLIALRELALRRTAERVDAQMRDYRSNESITPVWQTSERLLICIGADNQAERLIRRGARMASTLHAAWIVLYVETPKLQRLTAEQRNNVLVFLRLAQSLGAQVQTLSGTELTEQIADFAKSQNISRIILGRTHHKHLLKGNNTLPIQLAKLVPDIDLVLVGEEINNPNIKNAEIFKNHNDIWQHLDNLNLFSKKYLWTLLSSALVTVVATGLIHVFDLANVVMLYLLNVVLISVRFGRGSGILSSILSVICFDFFFVPPRFSFAVSDTQYLLTFAVMLAVAFIIANLSASLRFQARIAKHRENRANLQAQYSQALSGALTSGQINQLAITHMGQVFNSQIALFLPNMQDQLALATDINHNPITLSTELSKQLELGTAQWVYDHEQEAGLHTNTLAASKILYRPLRAPMRTRGVIAFLPNDVQTLFQPEQQKLLDSFNAQTALALERVHFVEVAQQALLKMESERMRGTLLSALSHDLRTPVTVLASLAASITKQNLSLHEYQKLAQSIENQADAIHSLVINLLEMVKLQSGGLKINKQWVTLEELIGAVLHHMQHRLQNHTVQVQLPANLPLVYIDELILSRVLNNVLENGVRYTPAQSTITIGAQFIASQQTIQLNIQDNGQGLPTGMEEKIFERFTRGQPESNQTGIGLGLSLCKELLTAMQGQITAKNIQPHGACFTIQWQQPPAPVINELE